MVIKWNYEIHYIANLFWIITSRVDKLTLSGGEVVVNKYAKHSKNNDTAALGNDDVNSEVELRSGKITQDNNNNLHNDPDFYWSKA